VHLKGAVSCGRRVVRVMIEQSQGRRMLNTSSTSAFIASSRPTIPYGGSKPGARQLTCRWQRTWCSGGIRVNAIA
jgi:NAD(P)-dependent dehydrogenase (short-subunit alcohol dehydrogenase family)